MNKEHYTGPDYINDALDTINLQLVKTPGFSLYVMAKNQLKYIKSTISGTKRHKCALHTKNF